MPLSHRLHAPCHMPVATFSVMNRTILRPTFWFVTLGESSIKAARMDEPVDRVADGIGTAWVFHIRHDGVECFEVLRWKRNADHDHGDSKMRLKFIRDRATAAAHASPRSRSGPT